MIQGSLKQYIQYTLKYRNNNRPYTGRYNYNKNAIYSLAQLQQRPINSSVSP